MFVKYAEITINVLAQESEMNGPNELRLSDTVGTIEDELKKWLKGEYGDKFRFEIELS